MILQNPSFLWGLFALAIPVIVHLFQFRRTTRIYFSNTRLLHEVKQDRQARQKLKHLLILASRLLFLLFLILAFCQPFLPATESNTPGRELVLYVDNSQSMSVTNGEGITGLESAILECREILQTFGADTRFKLLTNDFSPTSQSFKSRAEVDDELGKIRLTATTRSAQEIITRIGNAGSDVFYLSDFQKSTFGQQPTPDSSLTWHFVPIPLEPVANVFVDSVFLTNPFAAVGERNTLRVQVRNDGTRKVEQLVVRLLLNEVQSATATIAVAAGGIETIDFDLAPGVQHWTQVKVSFNDNPVSFDNNYFLALANKEKIKLVELTSEPGPTPIELVYGNTAIFEFRKYSPDNIDNSVLQNADFIIVNNIDKPTGGLLNSLRIYLQAGGAMAFIPGTAPDVSNWKEIIGPVRAVPKGPMLELEKPDSRSPFFEQVFESATASVQMPAASRVIDWGSDASAIMKFKDQTPFLTLQNVAGKCYLFASPLASTWNELPTNAVFVPLMYRLASLSASNQTRTAYVIGESPVVLKAETRHPDKPIVLKGAGEIIPQQRFNGKEVYLDIPGELIQPGFYVGLNDKDTLGLLAFNNSIDESLLSTMTETEMNQTLGGGANRRFFKAGNPEAFANEIKERYLGTPLWKYALLLAVLFIAMEMVLIRYLK